MPGGSASESAWKELVGASPESSGEFVTELLAKDAGWAAAYYDTLSRVSRTRQAYFADPHRLQTFYRALRGKDLSPSPTRPVFRPAPGLLLLVTNLQLDPDGQPHVPGGLAVWKDIIHRKGEPKLVANGARAPKAGRVPSN